jgi:hypothetical protein
MIHSEQTRRLDQTTRIHAPLPVTSGKAEPIPSWHEVGRPQVHGYDLVGVVSLDPLRLVSVADEKVARVFQAPQGFVKTMRGLGAVDIVADEVCQFKSTKQLTLSNTVLGIRRASR